jgi:hypothetical protein
LHEEQVGQQTFEEFYLCLHYLSFHIIAVASAYTAISAVAG